MAFELKRFGLDQRIVDILIDHKITELREIQKKALRLGLLKGRKLLIVAPSGSGKTLIGEIAAVDRILKQGTKSVFLVPLKAIANEKYAEFTEKYSKLGISIALRTGDIKDERLDVLKFDLIISTYERFDSLLRTVVEKEENWLGTVGTIVIDEIHILNDYYRGPRLEGLINRLQLYASDTQIIALSATIANPEELALWLNCNLVKSDHRPVPLAYEIVATADKIITINKYVIETLKQNGQVLVFAKTRKEAQALARGLTTVLLEHKLLDSDARVKLNNIFKNVEMTQRAKLDRSLISALRFGVAYHHAGLALSTRKLVEDNFRDHLIKVVCCTTTLAAGVNLPAMTVIVKDCQVITTDPNLIVGDDSLYWRNQLEPNLLHQILGRAGRPGYDDVGIGIILTPTNVDKNRIEQYYFHRHNGTLYPKYTNVKSKLNQREELKEQVLVRIREKKAMTARQILDDFQGSLLWHQIQYEDPSKPIDQLIEIGAISIQKTIEELSDAEIRKKARAIPDGAVQITKVDEKILQGIVSSNISHTCALFRDFPSCTCREFKFRETTGQITLCRHLIKLIEVGLKHYPSLTNDLACLSLQKEFIMDSLVKGNMVRLRGDEYVLTPLGDLIVTAYIKPQTAPVIRAHLARMTSIAEVLEAIRGIYTVEMHKYVDSDFAQIMSYVIERPPGEDIMPRILETSEKYFKGQGDIEEFISFTKWILSAIKKFGELYEVENAVYYAEEIERLLEIPREEE